MESEPIFPYINYVQNHGKMPRYAFWYVIRMHEVFIARHNCRKRLSTELIAHIVVWDITYIHAMFRPNYVPLMYIKGLDVT